MQKLTLTVLDHLQLVAQKATISSVDKGVINLSLKTLSTRLTAEFDRFEVARSVLFGAYTRDTMLPPVLDVHAHVDVLVLFVERGQLPGYYVEKLRKFAELHYPKSAITCDGRTLFIENLRVRYELIPALDSLNGLQIPLRRGAGSWQTIDPDAFAKSLQAKDQANQGLILPLVRLVKYWNTRNGYPFESFELEKRVVAHSFALSPKNLKAYFFDFMRSLNTAPSLAADKGECVRQSRKTLDAADKLMLAGKPHEAVAMIEEFLPLPSKTGF